ncbi:hypothetical protein JOF28_000949 [Leucobacter exalbidus]|uniref:Maltokinase N-terminal cap domain-containing protein n=1 Tax=Leucobacter exalbidus TaxID=662960 RepID=A0A940PKQ4_9MICO|nr:hypothetical protein [Leucobacter exalbidus]MBP1325717.1 hypothetical protein [Leucobacter exalbidus]
MSIIYQAKLTPSKYDLIKAWLPSQPWFTGDISRLEPVGSYRFDDPEGEVGCEGHLFTAGDARVFHAPLTYRSAPLASGEEFLAGTIEHGILGTRWVSDAIGDPVYRAALAAAIAQGGTGSREFLVAADFVSTPGGPEASEVGIEREPSVRVAGTGSQGVAVPELWAAQVEQQGSNSVAHTELATLELHRIIDPECDGTEDAPGTHTLRAAWGAADAAAGDADVAAGAGASAEARRIGALLATLRV